MAKSISNTPHCGRCDQGKFGPWKRNMTEKKDEKPIIGCRRLTKKKWDDGWRDDDDGKGWFQRNCPLSGIVRISEETRCV
jgi:hypothetical protein